MPNQEFFIEKYQTGDIPWDVGEPDFNLIDVVSDTPVLPGRALDIGCGTGDNAIWLAQKSFDVTGIDISDIAIDAAKKKAGKTQVNPLFEVGDFLDETVERNPFDFILDRGCFHMHDLEEERSFFAKKVASSLKNDGLWLTLVGSADDPPRETGPPMRSALDIITSVEPFFEILNLKKSVFATRHPEKRGMWVCLMRKRM